MFGILIECLDKADKFVWYILLFFLGITFSTMPAAIAYIVAQSSSIEIAGKGMEVSLRGEQINQSVDLLLIRLDSLEQANRELVEAARTRKNLNRKIEVVNHAIAQSNDVVDDLSQQQQALELAIE